MPAELPLTLTYNRICPACPKCAVTTALVYNARSQHTHACNTGKQLLLCWAGRLWLQAASSKCIAAMLQTDMTVQWLRG